MKIVKHVLDVKGHDVWSVHPNSTVYDAIEKMAEKNAGSLVVIEDDKLVGMLSERDYTRNIILKGKSSPKTQVREIMTAKVICTEPEQTIDQCMSIMSEKHIRHLPVMDGNKLVGMISIGDVVKSIIENQKSEIEGLYQYIKSG